MTLKSSLPISYRNAIELESAAFPMHLVKISKNKWPPMTKKFAPIIKSKLLEAWRSREFLVQIYRESGMTRLSINKIRMTEDGKNYQDGITWDEMQRLKSECGYGGQWAVELFPPDADVVNVANIRHLWICEAPEYGWNREREWK